MGNRQSEEKSPNWRADLLAGMTLLLAGVFGGWAVVLIGFCQRGDDVSFSLLLVIGILAGSAVALKKIKRTLLWLAPCWLIVPAICCFAYRLAAQHSSDGIGYALVAAIFAASGGFHFYARGQHNRQKEVERSRKKH